MQEQAAIFLEWYIRRSESGENQESPTLDDITAAFQDAKLVDDHIREMCTQLFGVPIVAKQTLTDQQWEMVREILNMRTGTAGAQMMAANAAILDGFADVAQAPGSRRERAPPGPNQRRASGEDPTEHGGWWQKTEYQRRQQGCCEGV